MVALLGYMTVRALVSGPLFVFQDDKYLTQEKLVGSVRQALRAAGVDTKGYSGHRFRIGAATTAALRGGGGGKFGAWEMGIIGLPSLPSHPHAIHWEPSQQDS